MLDGAGAGTTKVPPNGPGEQFGGPFLAFGRRHRRLAGARLWRGGTDQRECSGLRMVGSGSLPGISPVMSRLHDATTDAAAR